LEVIKIAKKKENVPERPVLVNLRPFTVLNNNEMKKQNKKTNKRGERRNLSNNLWKETFKNAQS